MCPQNYLKKSANTEKKEKQKAMKTFTILADSEDKTSFSGRFLRPHFQNSFPQTIFSCFLLQTPKCLETCEFAPQSMQRPKFTP